MTARDSLQMADGNGTSAVAGLVDLDRYPLHDADGLAVSALAARARADLERTGSATLPGFLTAAALERAVAEISPIMGAGSFRHARRHNVYFADDGEVPPALRGPAALQSTASHTVPGDLLADSAIRAVYDWPALPRFLATVLDRPALFAMADPLACLNVMGYGEGDGIGWHFDRAEFTVTVLLQAPLGGGRFQYRHNLRSAAVANHRGVARLLSGRDGEVRELDLTPGALNIFAGYRSPHRVTSVEGGRLRLVAILSFMERPEVTLSDADRQRFYGRARPVAS